MRKRVVVGQQRVTHSSAHGAWVPLWMETEAIGQGQRRSRRGLTLCWVHPIWVLRSLRMGSWMRTNGAHKRLMNPESWDYPWEQTGRSTCRRKLCWPRTPRSTHDSRIRVNQVGRCLLLRPACVL